MGEGEGKGIGDLEEGASQPDSTEMLGQKLYLCKIQPIMPHYVQVYTEVSSIFQ